MSGWGAGGWGAGGWGTGGAPLAPSGPSGELDAYTVDPGSDAGRIVPSFLDTGIRVSTTLFCLGHDLPGFKGFLNVNDYVEVSQIGTFTGNAIAVQPRTRPPAQSPGTGRGWKASILIDDVEVASRMLASAGAAPEDWQTWIVKTSALAGGDHKLAFRLTLVSV